MKPVIKLLLIAFLLVAFLDAVSAIASRVIGFNYGLLAPLSALIYGGFGFLAAKQNSFRTGVLVSAIVGFFESTVGWEISMRLDANTGTFNNHPTFSIWVITCIMVTAIAALFGLLGAWITIKLKRKQSSI